METRSRAVVERARAFVDIIKNALGWLDFPEDAFTRARDRTR